VNSDQDTMGDTSAVREQFRFNEGALEEYMRTHVRGFRGSLSVSQFTAGQSNPTYLLSAADQQFVLRRKPPGTLLASAHAIDREYRIMSTLGKYTQVPVPETLALCMDESVIGSSFFIMERVQGRIFWDVSFPEVCREQRPAYFDAMNATLASLHDIDFAAIGLGDFGRPNEYVRRQIKRWSRQYQEDAEAGQIPAMKMLMDWLIDHVPDSDEISIVHGDFRCDNLVFHPTEPQVIAILDWELSTLGNPLADFGYHLMMYYSPNLAIPGLLGRNLAAHNIPTPEQYIAAYCKHAGRADVANMSFYLAFNFFRFAAICHGIRGRLARGTAVSERAKEYAASVERLADLGLWHCK
jgi:aminoglycoside phosphotransferase (APT) family kinase protein